jgi:hypothetical protein
MHGVEHEQVVALRRLLRLRAVPEADLSLANGLGVGQQARAVKTVRCARDDEVVLDAGGDKFAAPEGPEFNRAVDQFLLVGCQVVAKAAF